MLKLTKGSLKRNGTAIEVSVDVALEITAGDIVQFNHRSYKVTGLGGEYQKGSKPHRYLYVEAAEPTTKSNLFVKEGACAKGRRIKLANYGPHCEPVELHIDVRPRKKEVVLTFTSLWYKESSGYGGRVSTRLC